MNGACHGLGEGAGGKSSGECRTWVVQEWGAGSGDLLHSCTYMWLTIFHCKLEMIGRMYFVICIFVAKSRNILLIPKILFNDLIF